MPALLDPAAHEPLSGRPWARRLHVWTGDMILPFFIDGCVTGSADVAGLDVL